MIKKIPLKNLLFLDIETVPENATFDELSEEKQRLWDEKTIYQRKQEFTAQEFYERAGIWAEFGKIICISVGFFAFKDGKRSFRTTSYFGDEKELLLNFSQLLQKHFNKQHLLCAHNGKEFDFPFIARRLVINDLELPEKLNNFGKKPWEVPHLDTLDLWKFGDYKHYTSLKLLCHVLNIPSPKEDIDGSQVYKTFYEDQDLAKIVAYCERDVIAIAQIILKLRQEPLLVTEEIFHK